ncbi:MAG: nuclear transport factor 2 family protein [Myxococcota bacterium]
MTARNIEAAKAFYARLAAGDMTAFFEILSDEVVAVSPGSRRHIPWAGTWAGKEQFGEMMNTLGEAADIELYEIARFIPDGEDGVIVCGQERLRSRQTQRLAETLWVHELTLRDGRITRFVEHYDTDTLAVALAG